MPSPLHSTRRPLVAIAVGALTVVALVWVSDLLTARVFERAVQVEALIHRVEFGAAGSHLWLEERLAGDDDPALPERIEADLADAREACALLRHGGSVDGARVAPLEQDGMGAANVAGLCDGLERLAELTAARLGVGEAAGSGSRLDDEYDRAYDQLAERTEEVEALVVGELARARSRLWLLDLALVGLVLVAFLAMAWFVHRSTRRVERLGHQQTVTLDAVPHAVLRLAPDGTIASANQAARTLLPEGHDRGAGPSVAELVQPLDDQGRPQPWSTTPFAAALDGGTKSAGEVLCRRADGTTFVAACTVTPIVVGEPEAGAVLVARDVTESRALTRERDELASISVETSDLALIGLPDGRLRWLNRAARDVIGFAPDEDVTGHRIEDLIPPDELERVYRDVMPVVVDEHSWHGELTLRDRDGENVPVWATMNAHHDALGNRLYVSCIMRDLRARLAEEERLRESERRLDEAQRIAQLGSWELDMTTGTVTFSAQMHQIYGTDPDTFEPTFDRFLGYVHPEDVPALQRDFAAALEGDGDYRGEFRIRRDDGQVRAISGRGTVVLSPGGSPVRMVGTNQDVTELREVEQLKRDFVSVVSHELRTPLTSIHGALRLLQAGLLSADPDRAARMVDIAESNTERLVRLINDLLDVERLAAGKVELQVAPTSLDGPVSRAVELMRAMADDANVALEMCVPPLLVELDGDRFLQVLTNLLSNAIKFSPPGATVQVSATPLDDDVEVRVTDAGRGIPADQLDRVFGRFNQVDPSDARDRSGTGLGLAICRALVEQHGGRIWAESEVGRGASFVVRLPRTDAAPSPELSTEPGDASHPPAPETSWTSRRVLVCDDDEDARLAMATTLRSHGYEVVLATDGEDAVVLSIADPPDVVVLDLLMPGLDGWETAARLREHPRTRGVPLVIVTVVPEDAAGALAHQVSAYVEKAAGPARLLEAVDRAVDDRPTLLLVEDDLDLAGVLAETFERQGIVVRHAASRQEALAWCEQLVPDLVVVDLGLPDAAGADVIDALRRRDHLGEVPLVVYTAAELSQDQRRTLADKATSVLIKSRVSPTDFERHVLRLVDRITGRQS